jgi:hypothetical protein
MIVQSSATTAPPLARAASTSADTATPTSDGPSRCGALDITAIVRLPRQTSFGDWDSIEHREINRRCLETEISRTGARNLERGQFRDEVIANSIRGSGGRCLPIQTEREQPAGTRRWLQCRMRRDGQGGASTLPASKSESRSTAPGWRRRRRGARPCPSAHDASAPLARSPNIPSLCPRVLTLPAAARLVGGAGSRRPPRRDTDRWKRETSPVCEDVHLNLRFHASAVSNLGRHQNGLLGRYLCGQLPTVRSK